MLGWRRAVLIVAILLLGIAEFGWSFAQWIRAQAQARAALVAQQQRAQLPMPPKRIFSRAEVYAFLDRAKQAETIADPQARCLAYPDPPGSHWPREAVAAYCRYKLMPVLDLATAQSLIEHGNAAELDRRLAEAEHAQRTQPPSRGLLDEIYLRDFAGDSMALRAMLDAWKRQSPTSAFALAASGTAYVAMAGSTRGGGYVRDTPASDLRSMDRLLEEGVAELRRALALDPKLTPAHTALIRAAGLGASTKVKDTLIDQALAAAPDDYSVYLMAMRFIEPRWGGSLRQMDALAALAQRHVPVNPMLALLASSRPFYQADVCDCTAQDELAYYAGAMQQAANLTQIVRADGEVFRHHDLPMAAVYLSEQLRFDPGNDQVRFQRTQALLDFDEAAWAVADLTRLLAAYPDDDDLRYARIDAYQAQNDQTHALRDLHALLTEHPHELAAEYRLGAAYLDVRQWNESWATASTLMVDHPDSPAGWFLRASVQLRQPRAGLEDTVKDMQARFGNDPKAARMLSALRKSMAATRTPAGAAPASH